MTKAQAPSPAKPATPSSSATGPAKSPLQTAQEAFKKGDFEAVTQLLWKQIENLDRSGMILLIRAHEKRKEWPEVIRASNLMISRKGNDEEALVALGNAQYSLGKQTEAKESLKKALEVNSKYQPAYEALTRIYEKNPYEQRLLYQDMVEAFGPKPEFLTKLCLINTNDGENEQGERVCQEAINKNPTIPDNHVNLGIISKQKGDNEKAQKRLKVAADKFKASEFAQFEMASFYEANKNYVDSYRYYDFCVKADPASERCNLGLGNSGVQVKKFDEALNGYRLACRKSGRKHSGDIRKASYLLRSQKSFDWATKFEELAEKCSFQ